MDIPACRDFLAPPLIDNTIEYPMPEGNEPPVSRLAFLAKDKRFEYQAVFQSVVEAVFSAIPCRFVVYHVFDFQGRNLLTQCGSHLPENYPTVGPLAGKIPFEALGSRRRKTTICMDLQTSEFAATDPDVRQFDLLTFMGAAVRAGTDVLGVLAVYDHRHDKNELPTTRLVPFLEKMAQLLSQIEARCKGEAWLNREINNQKLIAVISATAISAPPDKYLPYCLKKIGQWAQADGAAFFWTEADTLQLQAKFEYWSRTSSAGRPVVEPRALKSLDFVTDVLQYQKSIFCTDPETLEGAAMQELFQGRALSMVLSVPICSQKNALGLCCLHFSGELSDWEPEDLETLTTVLDIVAQWRNARSISNELDESQTLNNMMLQLSPSAIYTVDFRTNRLVSMNDYLLQYSEYSEEELRSMNPEEILVPESREAYRRRILDALAGREVPDSVEYQIRSKSGNVQWARMQVRFCYEDGRLTRSIVVAHNVTEQKKIMEELSDYRKKLEALVEERTHALMETNQKLHQEIAIRTRTAKQLKMKSERLKELNTAMGVLLDKRKEDRLLALEHVRVNLRQLVEPYLERLADGGLNSTQRQILDVIRMNVREVVGAPIADVTDKYYIFSPSELQVANLIRNGKTTKDIARLLRISARTVESYRNNIRKKLGLQNRGVNLRTYLLSKE